MTTSIKCKSLNEGYQLMIEELKNKSSVSYGRQQGKIHELLDYELVLENPRASLLSLPIRNMSRRYAAGELCLYLEGSNEVKDFAFYSKTWEKIANPDGTINSAYGARMFNYPEGEISRFGFAIKQLVENPDSKNAIIHMRDNSDIKSDCKDRCCTMFLQFYIRDGKFNMRTCMRSTDFWLGLPYDVFCFTRIMQIAMFEYNSSVPEDKRVVLGEYTHQMLNVHVYEKHWDRIKDYTPITLHTERAYEYPEYGIKDAEEHTAFLNWEKEYRNNAVIAEEDKAVALRDLKLHPFFETLGSCILNKIKNCMPTAHDIEMFHLAEETAKNSKCIDRQVGCVICDRDGNVMGSACNTVINCNKKCDDKLTRVCNVTHSEVKTIESVPENLRALMQVAYVTLYPCLPCRNALNNAGIFDIRVKGFSHKGASGLNVINLYDPEYTD